MVVIAPERPAIVEPVVIEPRKTSETGDTLRAAAREIVERGWHQGALMSAEGEVCMLGAIVLGAGGTLANGTHYWPSGSYGRYSRAARVILHYLQGRDIAPYNDSPGRTREEVLNLLKAVAGRADTECV